MCRCGITGETPAQVALFCPELWHERRQLRQTLLPQTLHPTRDLAAATTDPASEEAVVRWLLATNHLPEYRHTCRYAAIQDQKERGQEYALKWIT